MSERVWRHPVRDRPRSPSGPSTGTRSQPVPGPMPVHQITAAIRSARMLSDSGDLSARGCCSSAGSMPGGGATMPARGRLLIDGVPELRSAVVGVGNVPPQVLPEPELERHASGRDARRAG
jgi:hypothetical protein